MNIVLIGFMGTGKSTVGKLLAERFGFDYIDTDLAIEKKQNQTITEIFKTNGETKFRQLEAELALELSSAQHKVIATGGGFVLNQLNIHRLRANSLIVALMATPEAIYERVKHETQRPLLAVDNPRAQIARLLKERTKYYREADIIVDTTGKTPAEISAEIEQEFMRRGYTDGRS